MAEIHFSEHVRFELRSLEAFTIPPRRFEGESDTNYAKRVQRIEESNKRIEALGFGKLIKSEEETLKAIEVIREKEIEFNKIGDSAIELVKTYRERLEKLGVGRQIVDRTPLDVLIHLKIQKMIPDYSYDDLNPYCYIDIWERLEKAGLMGFGIQLRESMFL